MKFDNMFEVDETAATFPMLKVVEDDDATEPCFTLPETQPLFRCPE